MWRFISLEKSVVKKVEAQRRWWLTTRWMDLITDYDFLCMSMQFPNHSLFLCNLQLSGRYFTDIHVGTSLLIEWKSYCETFYILNCSTISFNLWFTRIAVSFLHAVVPKWTLTMSAGDIKVELDLHGPCSLWMLQLEGFI